MWYPEIFDSRLDRPDTVQIDEHLGFGKAPAIQDCDGSIIGQTGAIRQVNDLPTGLAG
jgi:hypothetical protein